MGVLNPHSAFKELALTAGDANLQLLRAERQLRRERTARLEAEAIAERGLRDLYISQQRLALLQRIAVAANQSSSVDAALRFTVEEICQHTGWAFGNVYICPEDAPDRLEACDIWFAADPDGIFPFVELSRNYVFQAGIGLPGRILAAPRACWIPDVTIDTNFPRAPTAHACGLHSAFAFPVLVGTDVAAVMEFFARETLQPDDEMLSIMSQVGTQLGRVIERKRAEDRLIHDALHDPLTGLPNRTLFIDRLSIALDRGLRNPAARYAVIFIDLDRFKLINDGLGHAAGDRLLIDIAARVRDTIEKYGEKADWRWTLARMGGDEFTVLLDDLGDGGIANEVTRRLHACLKPAHLSEGREIYITASMGIAYGHPDYRNADEIMRDADLAMYESKAKGRARTAVFDERLRKQINHRLLIESELRRAIERHEFLLHYQPIVSLSDRKLIGFEALVRWQRGPGDLVEPTEFIQVAEETGLIVFIGNWVLREACTTVAGWHRSLGGTGLPCISINISPRQFLQPNFVRHVRTVLLDSDIDPVTVHLEITEGMAIPDPHGTGRIIRELKNWGVRVSLDDFGTGYSSLSYLHRLQFDTLKIDRSFVSSIDQNDTQGIVQAVLDLARTLSMDVVAEGIETEAQAARLQAMGCQLGQGYLFGEPLDMVDAERLLHSGT